MISGIILASGFSRRMGKEKLLLNIGGVPMLERVIRVAQTSTLDKVILIYHRDEVRKLGESCGVRTVFNPHPECGQSAAVKVGVHSAHPLSSGFMFLVGDQPYLRASTIDTLISVFKRDTSRIVIPTYGDTKGNPVIFPLALKHELLSIDGDQGARVIIERVQHPVTLVGIDWQLEATDVDTADDYKNIRDDSG